MHGTDFIAGSALGIIAFACAATLFVVYLLAPLVLYGIYSRLGRLIELQEYLASRQPPPHDADLQSPAHPAAAQWSKL